MGGEIMGSYTPTKRRGGKSFTYAEGGTQEDHCSSFTTLMT